MQGLPDFHERGAVWDQPALGGPKRTRDGSRTADRSCLVKRQGLHSALLGSWRQIENDPELIDDLTGPEIYFQPNGKKKLEAKKQMKVCGLQSPDKGDGLALTFAAPAQKADSLGKQPGGSKWVTELDPLG